MARELLILWAGRHRRKEWETLYADYRARIERFRLVRDQLVKVRRSGGDATRRPSEGRALLAALPDPCWTIALDEQGRRMDSRGFAAEMRRLAQQWPHPSLS